MQMEQFYEVGADEEVFVVGQIDTMQNAVSEHKVIYEPRGGSNMKMEFRENLSNHLTESLEPSQMLQHRNKNVMATKPKAFDLLIDN